MVEKVNTFNIKYFYLKSILYEYLNWYFNPSIANGTYVFHGGSDDHKSFNICQIALILNTICNDIYFPYTEKHSLPKNLNLIQ